MTARRWDGTSWVPFNELLSRFGDATIRPTIKHYQDGVFGLGWYPLRTIKRWDGTAWVNVWQARLLPPPPPPKPDPTTGITPPPPTPPPVQGPVIFNDEGIPMELNEEGEIVPYNQVPGNFDTDFTALPDGTITDTGPVGTLDQQRALIRRTIGNLKTATAASAARTIRIDTQRARYTTARTNIVNARLLPTIVVRLRQVFNLYTNVKFNPSRFLVNAIITLRTTANAIHRRFRNDPLLGVEVRMLRAALDNLIAQQGAEILANETRTRARDAMRDLYHDIRDSPAFLTFVSSARVLPLPPSSAD